MSSSPSEVSLPVRLAWLGAALWIIAVKAVVVTTWTPVEVTAARGRLLIYALAIGLPFVPLLAVLVRSALRRRLRAGLASSAAAGLLLYALAASGLAATAWEARSSWQTHEVLYRHTDDPGRTIERQRRTPNGRAERRIVQTRPITAFLSYTEPAQATDPGPEWAAATSGDR